eukprot:CAMPEP_0197664704 /NCGR_PEP_ID=MMETSP1338-20131121/58798_1 /TAXON_ID=43686 ORGANISM="Pelagodinium beii, Strain RCC1491" /NCGR_SAMPLE_ID=MMETSP1338 /ASSEMBLY_ACC=CAM_ASM_000754 /LENGTH=665 /DNA_ID=CAMNT_0043243399 /DNA_START=197 /DNA_END=2194 /DNA_ORIENTATION=-
MKPEESSLLRREELSLQDWNADSLLLCSFNGDTDIYQEDHMDFEMVMGEGKMTKLGLEALIGFDPRTSARNPKKLLAQDAHSIAMNHLSVLNQLAQILKTDWWLTGGGLIGALRTQSLIPWDDDLDFCLASKFSATQIEGALNATNVKELAHNLFGFQLHHLGFPDDFMVYDSEGVKLMIFHSPEGFKTEMQYDDWKCNAMGRYAMPVRSMEMLSETQLGKVHISIPQNALAWLAYNEFPGDADFNVIQGSIAMPLGRYTSCYTCPSEDSLINGTSEGFYVFQATGIHNTVKFKSRLNVNPGKQCSRVDLKSIDKVPVMTIVDPLHHEPSNADLLVRAVAVAACLAAIVYQASQKDKGLVEFSCVATYLLLTVSDYIIARFATRNHGGLPFGAMKATVVVEAGKLIFTLLLILVTGKVGLFKEVSARDVQLLCVPALGYFLQNTLFYLTMSQTSMATWVVLYELQILFVTLLWGFTFKRWPSRVRMLACSGVTMAVALQTNGQGAVASLAVLLPVFCALVTATNCVSNEYVYKYKREMDINIQNSVVYTAGICFGLISVALFEEREGKFEFFQGMQFLDVKLLLLNRLILGLAVSRLLKYVDSISKTMASSLSGPITIAIMPGITCEQITLTDAVATIAIFPCSFLYWVDPSLRKMSTEELKRKK